MSNSRTASDSQLTKKTKSKKSVFSPILEGIFQKESKRGVAGIHLWHKVILLIVCLGVQINLMPQKIVLKKIEKISVISTTNIDWKHWRTICGTK